MMLAAVLSCSKAEQTSIIPVSSIELNEQGAMLYIGQTIRLQATVLPADATDSTVGWLSMDETVATVSPDGLVSALALGSATIKAVSVDGRKTAEFALVVSEHGDEPGDVIGDIEPFK